jgi:hypothetical protein
MKGQSMEMVELVVIVIGSSILIVSSYFFFTGRVPEEAELSTEQHMYEILAEDVKNFFYTKIPTIDKTYAQMLGDMIANDANDTVYYGDRYGGINVTKIIYEYFDSYFEKNWHLKVYDTKGYNFGYEVPSQIRVRTFLVRYPVPSYAGEVIEFELKEW